ncbi:MAG TPA: DMT family transporter [Thermoleophilia bacterium]|nr:DMT family transporter [Thermoleophilia bacterium]
MITRYLLGAAMFAVGMTAAIQPPINAALAKRTGGLESATISFAVGTAVLLLLTVVLGNGSLWAARGAPAWQWTGGLVGALFVWATIVMVPRLGAAGLIAGVVAGQLVGGVVIDRFGLFGLPQTSISSTRVAGLVLLLVGGALVVRR